MFQVLMGDIGIARVFFEPSSNEIDPKESMMTDEKEAERLVLGVVLSQTWLCFSSRTF